MTRWIQTTIVLGLLCGLVPALSANDNWPEFRGPSANGHSDSKGLPREWSESKNVVWKTALHDEGWSSPVVWGKQVWLTAATKDGKRLFVICVDRDTGKIRLDRKLFDVPRPEDTRKFNSYASPTPAIEEGRVYVHFGSYGTACLDTKTGKVLWTRQDLACNHWRGPGSSPILYRNLVIIHFDGYDQQYVVALDKGTGRTMWKAVRSHDYGTDNGDFKKAFATPTIVHVGGRPLLISPAAKATLALDPMTGREIWRVKYGNHSAAARPIAGNGMVYINTGFGRADILAVRPDGRVVWKASKGIGSKPSPILVGDLIYSLGDKGGVLTCLDAKTGKEVWKERIAGGAHSASPVYGDGLLYFYGEDGTTVVVRPGRQFAQVAVNKLEGGGRCMGSPAIAGKSMFIRTGSHLYRIEKRS